MVKLGLSTAKSKVFQTRWWLHIFTVLRGYNLHIGQTESVGVIFLLYDLNQMQSNPEDKAAVRWQAVSQV